MTKKKESASNKVITTLSRQIKTEISEVKERLDVVDVRLGSIDENLAQHMKRTALLEANQDRVISTFDKLQPVLDDMRAAKKAAEWIYKPVTMLIGAGCMLLIGAKNDLIIEILKKMIGD